MKDAVDIEVIIDENFKDPLVNIFTCEETEQVDNIIYAIENAGTSEYPPIAAYNDGRLSFIAQRKIYRIQMEGRSVILETANGSYVVKDSLLSLEEHLDPARFIRISQSEIINLYMVDSFDFSISGTITVIFENGEKSWVSRRRVKELKDLLKTYA